MRKKYINYTVALLLAFIFMIGARCVRVYMETMVVSAAPDQYKADQIISIITDECEITPTEIISPTVTPLPQTGFQKHQPRRQPLRLSTAMNFLRRSTR